MRKPRNGIVERFLRHLILSRDFHTSLMLYTLSLGSAWEEHDDTLDWHALNVVCLSSCCMQIICLFIKHQEIVGELFSGPYDRIWCNYLPLASYIFLNRHLIMCDRVVFFSFSGKEVDKIHWLANHEKLKALQDIKDNNMPNNALLM